jgi:hypothetical protein
MDNRKIITTLEYIDDSLSPFNRAPQPPPPPPTLRYEDDIPDLIPTNP